MAPPATKVAWQRAGADVPDEAPALGDSASTRYASPRRLPATLVAVFYHAALAAGPARRTHDKAGLWTSKTTTRHWASKGAPPTKRSARRTASWPVSITPTSTPATRTRKRASRRSTKRTRCSPTLRSASCTTSWGHVGASTSSSARQGGRPRRRSSCVAPRRAAPARAVVRATSTAP